MIHAPDLTKRPPRSPRVRLGGYVILPRILDKGRALLAFQLGEYKYACPLDQRFLEFAGIDPEALKQQLAKGLGDGEILAWVQANATPQRDASEVASWSRHHEERAPGDLDSKRFYAATLEKIGPERSDIITWFDLLDLDDYVSFGGQA
jgi:hypothetical protein